MTTINNLVLNNNKIEELPVEIGQLLTLTGLNINNNNIKSLPTEIGALIKLQGFYSNGNGITEIPESFSELKELRFFEVADNNLTIIPDSVASLEKLKKVNIKNNYLTKINFNENVKVVSDGNFLDTKVEIKAISNKKIDIKVDEGINLLDYVEVIGSDRKLNSEVVEVRLDSNKGVFKIGETPTTIIGVQKGVEKVTIKLKNSEGKKFEARVDVRIK